MKVLYIIPGLGIGGGAERSLLDLAPRLREEGIDLSIAYFHDRPTSAAPALEELGIPVRHLRASRFTGRVRALRREIRRQDPDVVHTTLFEADVAGRLAAVGLRPKVLTSLVTTPYAPARRVDPAWSNLRMGVVRRIDGATLRLLTDAVHANSIAVREAAVRDLGADPDRITVAPRGRADVAVDPGAARMVRSELEVPDEVPLLLVVGRQEATKGHLDLVAALAEVVRQRDVVVALVGRDGAATPAIDAAIEDRGLDGAVRRLGYRSDVPELLAASDAFVFPSVLEGMPGAVIEAMAAEVPIVATAIDPVRELLDPTSALLVPPHAPDALASAIEEVLADRPAAAARAAVGRRRFLEAYTVDHALDAMVDLYRSVASA